MSYCHNLILLKCVKDPTVTAYHIVKNDMCHSVRISYCYFIVCHSVKMSTKQKEEKPLSTHVLQCVILSYCYIVSYISYCHNVILWQYTMNVTVSHCRTEFMVRISTWYLHQTLGTMFWGLVDGLSQSIKLVLNLTSLNCGSLNWRQCLSWWTKDGSRFTIV